MIGTNFRILSIEEASAHINLDDKHIELIKESKKVVIQCPECNEVLCRDTMNIKLYHNCPTHKYDGNTWLKRCYNCHKYLPYDSYNKSTTSRDGLCDPCNTCATAITVYERPLKFRAGPIRFEIKLEHPDAKMPFRKRDTDIGYDVSSVENVTVMPHSMANIDTGIRVSCPPGSYFTIEGRSSIWINGVSPYRGVIDPGYNGHLRVALMNISDVPYVINVGDRIAQIVAHYQNNIDFAIVEEFGPEYNIRGEDGFGSSGK